MGKKVLSPLKHEPSTHEEKASTVELAGWGNHSDGNGAAVTVRGEIAVDTHECGLLHFTFISHGWGPEMFMRRFFGAKKDETIADGSWVIPPGSRFYAHPMHIRAITMAQKVEAKS